MNTQMNGEPRQSSTTDLAVSANTPPLSAHDADMPVFAVNTDGVIQTTPEKTLAPLFTPNAATDFRSRWDVVQRGFVDDPEEAVRAGDELVTQVIKSLSESFSEQRSVLEGDMKTEKSSTENRRLAFRRYRSFFDRLLSI
jgi:hypothetical protein